MTALEPDAETRGSVPVSSIYHIVVVEDEYTNLPISYIIPVVMELKEE